MTKNFKAISLFMLILIAVGIICSCGGNGVDTDLGVNSDTTSQDTVIDSNPNKPVTSITETEISSDLITDTSTDTNTDINADSGEIIDTESDITTNIGSDSIINTETDLETDLNTDSEKDSNTTDTENIDTENGDNGNGNNPEDNDIPKDNGSNEDLWTGNKQ